MDTEPLDELICPDCSRPLRADVGQPVAGQIRDGSFHCDDCRSTFPVIRSIPRFVVSGHYADSFGFQWNQHARTQLDSESNAPVSRRRFESVTGWTSLQGQTILEVGCGSGRFTELALETGADVYAIDASNAVEANWRNNGSHPRLHVMQADLYRLPFEPGTFDKVLCLGVLQHCPDVKGAFLTLTKYVKPGGEIVIDVYDLSPRALVNPKYWLRPFTRRLPADTLYRAVGRAVPILYPIKRWVTERIPVFGRYLAFLIPVAYHSGFIAGAEELTDEQLIEWSVLDTFDKLAPAYDRPQRIGTVRRWFKEAALDHVDVHYGPNGIVGRARRPNAIIAPETDGRLSLAR